MKLNLKKVYVVENQDGNPEGFGPGVAEVPDWAIEKLKARGVDIEATQVSEHSDSEELQPGEPAVGLPENRPSLPSDDGSEPIVGFSNIVDN